MTVHAIIPARGRSKGIPRKNIMPICGKPLLAWTIEQSLQAQRVGGTYVSTDDPEIAAVATSFGAEVILRPAELATDSASTESAVEHALSIIAGEHSIASDIVVLLQPTSPLRKPEDIDRAVDQFVREKADSLFSAARVDDFLLWEQGEKDWRSLNYDYLNRGRRQDRAPQFVENGSIYIFRPEILRREKNRLGGRISVYEMAFWQTWEIDSPDDVELVEYYLTAKIKRDQISALKHATIDLLVFDFDGVFTDNKVFTFEDGREGVFANRGDGLAISAFKKMNIPMLILSTEKNQVVEARAKKLGVPCISGVASKKKVLQDYCKRHDIPVENILYVGNDLNDLEAMKLIGWPVCPMDAAEEVKSIATLVLARRGGEGVIRELWNYFR